VLLVDASLSMRAVQHGISLFSRAQAEAAGLLRSLESGSEAGIVLAGATPRALLPALSRNLPALHEELIQAQPTYEAGNFTAALALAKRLLGGPGTIYILSDFQKSNWEQVGELPAGVTCRLRPMTTEPVENVALVSARLTPTEPVAGEDTEVVCTVFNCTSQPREETVRLELGEFAQEQRVAVPAFSRADAAFHLSFPQEGVFVGKASLPPDDLREDDTRYLAVRVHKALQVLVVSDADAEDHRSAAFFVSRALVPSPQAAPGLNLVRRHSQDADRGALETAEVFVLVAPAAPSGEAVQIIERRVAEGARYIALLDGPTAPSLVPAGLRPPFQLLRTVNSEAGDALVPGPRKLFADTDAGDWSSLHFRRHYQTQMLDNRNDEVMLAYPDGAVALSFSTVGKGAAVFANLPLTPDGGDFIGHPMFPAVLHELIRALRRGSDEPAVTPGTAWVLESPTVGEGALAIMDPENRPVEAKVLVSGRTTRLALPPARLPGIYLARQNDRTTAAEAVNVDPRESDTRPIALASLKPGAGAVVEIVRNEADLVLGENSKPLWPHAGAAAAGCFGLEMLLLAFWRRPAPRS
jgi:hypothetical protein